MPKNENATSMAEISLLRYFVIRRTSLFAYVIMITWRYSETRDNENLFCLIFQLSLMVSPNRQGLWKQFDQVYSIEHVQQSKHLHYVHLPKLCM